MIAWMLYSAVVAMVVAAAARSAEWLARSIGYRVRWIWLGALIVTTALTGVAAVRSAMPRPAGRLVAMSVPVSTRTALVAESNWQTEVRVAMTRVRNVLVSPVVATATVVRRSVPRPVDRLGLVGATASSVAVFALLAFVLARFARARRRWPLELLHGVDVRVAPTIGPVVIGVVRPEIVVPRWLITRHDDEQRLVLAHESEHVRAGDPLLLGAGWVAVALAPWNPALWYMLSRLRLGIELDCDARVLRRGAAPRAYGTLLIDVAQQASGLGASALALAAENSHLHQRILAMKPTRPSFIPLRAALAATFSVGALLTACVASLPTDAQVAEMDAASATKAASQILSDSSVIEYVVNGRAVSASEALDIKAAEIAKVEVTKGDHSQIRITKKTLPEITGTELDSVTTDSARVAYRMADNAPRVISDSAVVVVGKPGPTGVRIRLNGVRRRGDLHDVEARTSDEGFSGLLLIDGVRADPARMKGIDPKTIESIEVIKGAAAVTQFGTEAEKGVIRITTKK